MEKAKIFWSGRSQAVRLPKEFRFEDKEVYISKENGRVVLTPYALADWASFFSQYPPCQDFILERNDNLLPQDRVLQ